MGGRRRCRGRWVEILDHADPASKAQLGLLAQRGGKVCKRSGEGGIGHACKTLAFVEGAVPRHVGNVVNVTWRKTRCAAAAQATRSSAAPTPRRPWAGCTSISAMCKAWSSTCASKKPTGASLCGNAATHSKDAAMPADSVGAGSVCVRNPGGPPANTEAGNCAAASRSMAAISARSAAVASRRW